MGAWGIGSFDNDDALDWVIELEAADDSAILDAAFNTILDDTAQYLDAPDCCSAIAAAEVVAALLGKPDDALPEDVQVWVSARPAIDDTLTARARQALASILKVSELKELWEEVDEYDQWLAAVNGLIGRLR